MARQPVRIRPDMAKSKRKRSAAAANDRKRLKQLTLRVSDAEHEAFMRTAAELDLPMTTWIRLVCRRAAGLPTP